MALVCVFMRLVSTIKAWAAERISVALEHIWLLLTRTSNEKWIGPRRFRERDNIRLKCVAALNFHHLFDKVAMFSGSKVTNSLITVF